MPSGRRLAVLVLSASLSTIDVDSQSALARSQATNAVAAVAPDEVSARLAARIPELMERAVVSGVQVAWIRDGAVAWNGAFGVAHAGSGVEVTPTSVFEAASLTKPVFAYAVLSLADEGRIDLDAPIVNYLPGRYDLEADDLLGRVTARHVLSHRSGFPNWRPGGQPLQIHFPPGERFSYSGEGFVYLSAAVERITGETTEAFVRRRVFEPLAMADSSLVWQARYAPAKAFGHGIIGNVAGRGTPWKANAAASLHTTAQDYARFLVAIIGGTGLKSDTARQMLAPQSRLDEAGFNTIARAPTGRLAPTLAWGLGWGLEQDGEGWSAWHWGDNGPFKAFVTVSPSRGTGIVAFANSQNGLSIMPALVREAMGRSSAAFAWLDIREPVPAFGQFVRTLRARGAGRAIEDYRASRRGSSGSPAMSEGTVNAIGYALLREKKVADAVAVFEMNVEDHPGSWNVHDSLGEALAVAGDAPAAIKAYERSIQLNPDNAGGRQAIEKLKTAPAPKQ